jgi:MFS family permease
LAQRARVQGLFSAMWAVAAIVGPLMGAAFVSTVGWRWIFGINLPIGLVSALLLWGYREPGERRAEGGIDLRGAAALTVGVALLLWGLGAGNPAAQPVLPAAAVAVAIITGFVVIEMRSSRPTIPLALLRRASIGPPMLISLLAGTVMLGTTAYVPLFVQGALGGSTYEAGAAVALMSLGWPIAAVVSGRILLRVGFRRLAVAGALLLIAGTCMLALRPAGFGVVWVGICSLVIGAGLGTITTPVMIVSQSAVPWEQRGAITALNQFSRTIGGAVGVAGMGILLVAGVRTQAARLGLPPSASANPLDAGAGAASRMLLGTGLETVFWVLVGLALATLAAALATLLRGSATEAELTE